MSTGWLSVLIVVITLFALFGSLAALVIIQKLDAIHALANSRLSSALKEIQTLRRVVIILASQQRIEDPALQEIISQAGSVDSETDRKTESI